MDFMQELGIKPRGDTNALFQWLLFGVKKASIMFRPILAISIGLSGTPAACAIYFGLE
jgi:hypothetical protein